MFGSRITLTTFQCAIDITLSSFNLWSALVKRNKNLIFSGILEQNTAQR